MTPTDAHTWLCDQYRRLLAVAQAATPGPWDFQAAPDGAWYIEPASHHAAADVGQVADHDDAVHIATFDPALTAAVCRAALEMLERHKPVSPDVWASGTPRPTWCFSCTSAEYLAWPCPDALSLAAPFVDLPDFPEELNRG